MVYEICIIKNTRIKDGTMSSTINHYEKIFTYIFMVRASKANMLTDQLDKTNNYCFFAKCHVTDMKVMGPSDKALKHK